jgi:hypothetical protein
MKWWIPHITIKFFQMNSNFYGLLFVLAFLGITTGYGQGLDLFIAPGGDDDASGTKEYPLGSLDGARDKIRELKKKNTYTDTIRVHISPGRYVMKSTFVLGPEDAGPDQVPILFQGEDPENTVFTGGIKLVGFKETDDGTWICQIPEVAYWNWTFDQLYVNGKRAIRARIPNDRYFFIEDVQEEVWIKGTGRAPDRALQIITAEAAAGNALRNLDKEALSRVILTVYHNWDITKRHIDSFDPSNNKIYTIGMGMKPWNPWKPGKRFILENFKDALDQPGEWYLEESGTLHYMPLPGEKMEHTAFVAPVVEQLLRIEGSPQKGQFVENVIFRNIQFTHSAHYLDHKGFEPNQAAIVIPAAVELNGAKNIRFENCRFYHLGGYAIWLNKGVSKCMVQHSMLKDLGAGGIRIGETLIREEEYLFTMENIVDNNIITSGGHEFPPAVGVWIGQSANNRITNNDISDFRYTGVSVGWRWGYEHSPAKGNKILNNHIHHIGWGLLSDMSGVYTLGPSAGTEVSNNHVHHIYAYDYGGWGLYTDEGSSHILMENNLVHHTKTGGFHQHYGKENIIRNNIFAFSKLFQLQATRVEDHLSFTFSNNIVIYEEGVLYQGPWDKMNVSIDQNMYWNLDRPVGLPGGDLKAWQKNGYDQHSYIQDPGFKDPKAGDFSFIKRKSTAKIGFKPFDYTSYGVYGNDSWKNKALLPEEIIETYDQFFKQDPVSSK